MHIVLTSLWKFFNKCVIIQIILYVMLAQKKYKQYYIFIPNN